MDRRQAAREPESYVARRKSRQAFSSLKVDQLALTDSQDSSAQALASFCTISDAYTTLSKDKLLNNQFAVVIPLWNLIICESPL